VEAVNNVTRLDCTAPATRSLTAYISVRITRKLQAGATMVSLIIIIIIIIILLLLQPSGLHLLARSNSELISEIMNQLGI
jgi:amino acid transporter